MNDYNNLIKLIKARLEQKDKSPLYVKVAESVKQAIQQKLLVGGDFLPTERELSEMLGISRITVRKALDVLDKDGVIVRSRGCGTMVSDTLEYSLKEPKGFSQQVVLKGKRPDTLWIKKEVVPCNDDVASQLDISAGDEVFLLKRIRYIDDQPVSIEESYVPAHLIGDADDIQMSLYEYFQSQNITLTRTKSRVSAQLPTDEFLEHLGLKSTVPVLVIKQAAYDVTGQVMEYSVNYCRGDMYVFVAEN
ncbi:GntR family transcriptional regulator [Photobacterium sanctipauli]|uniref:GntR family transcriptional regulator n=1 Tax=Photobacterium sanctipauli TaxID=1342794 RepID=A0A2T3NW90_9GAMM|nr:GntR family transcriptional regulator [Photobacterium sanctipauli]PSW20488.1 GntR family transcriptional regulator [Photobacterium sanctipauli]